MPRGKPSVRFVMLMPEDLMVEVDKARGRIGRVPWIRQAVEQVIFGAVLPPDNLSRPSLHTAARSSSDVKRDIQPIPKKR